MIKGGIIQIYGKYHVFFAAGQPQILAANLGIASPSGKDRKG
jgi:hypothetical protein